MDKRAYGEPEEPEGKGIGCFLMVLGFLLLVCVVKAVQLLIAKGG